MMFSVSLDFLAISCQIEWVSGHQYTHWGPQLPKLLNVDN